MYLSKYLYMYVYMCMYVCAILSHSIHDKLLMLNLTTAAVFVGRGLLFTYSQQFKLCL